MARAGGFDDLPAPSSVAVGGRRLPKGERDRFGTAREGCAKCAARASSSNGGGVVILFYAYARVSDPNALAARLRTACDTAGVTGKIRVAAEGINGTAAGPAEGVDALIGALVNDAREPEIASASRTMDWKRQRGCAPLFDAVSVRVVPEIVPFGDHARAIKVQTPALQTPVERLDPAAFHAEATRLVAAAAADGSLANETVADEGLVLLDVRNWYESRVGHFAGAVRAPIRRFSQLREWLDLEPQKKRFAGKRVLAYCTGGVRCEKACAFLASLGPDRRPRSVALLEGGVAAYARDVAGHETSERLAKTPDGSIEAHTQSPSLFLGSNFVFDARGATRVTDDVVGWCDGCGGRTDRVDACAGGGCHTLLLVCEACAAPETGPPPPGPTPGDPKSGGVFCCASCEAQEAERLRAARATGERKRKRRRPCDCDGYAARERRLSREKPPEA